MDSRATSPAHSTSSRTEEKIEWRPIPEESFQLQMCQMMSQMMEQMQILRLNQERFLPATERKEMPQPDHHPRSEFAENFQEGLQPQGDQSPSKNPEFSSPKRPLQSDFQPDRHPQIQVPQHQIPPADFHKYHQVPCRDHRPYDSFGAMPEFAGQLDQDPDEYLWELETYFTNTRLVPTQWGQVALQSLKGKAREAFKALLPTRISWKEFCNEVRLRFNNEAILREISLKFHGEHQEVNESVEEFILTKAQLARRLDPPITKQRMINTIIDLLHRQIRVFLRGFTFQDVHDLIQRAREVEMDRRPDTEKPVSSPKPRNEDVRAELPKTTPRRFEPARSTPSPPNRTTPTSSRPNRAWEPPKCHFCPERHFHRDCPVATGRSNAPRLPGNEQRAGPSN